MDTHQATGIPYPELRDLMDKHMQKLVQETVANLCGVSQGWLSQWTTGNKRPRPLQAAALASVLELDPRVVAAAAGYDQEGQDHIASLYEHHYFHDARELVQNAEGRGTDPRRHPLPGM